MTPQDRVLEQFALKHGRVHICNDLQREDSKRFTAPCGESISVHKDGHVKECAPRHNIDWNRV